jgi:putative DNA primase/helicase
VSEDAFEADLLAVAVKDYLTPKYPDRWEGTPAALQVALDEVTPEFFHKNKSWPKTPAAVGNAIKRSKPLLEEKGYTIVRRHSGTRSIIIVPPQSEAVGS